MAGPKKVLIVDDDPGIVDFISLGLRYEGCEVVCANSGLQALDIFQKTLPDLVILDWMLPDIQGTDICRRLRSQSNVFIIILTAKDEVANRVEGLRSGADDYLIKPFHFDELLARMEALFRRYGDDSGSELIKYASLSLNLNNHEVYRDGKQIILTPTEFNLLSLLLKNPRKVFSKDTLLDKVWGYDYAGDANIVEVYIGYLRKKLGDPPLIRTLRGIGYVLEKELSKQ
ncbi:MAG: response regulator transcription factor [Methanobacterium sp.]